VNKEMTKEETQNLFKKFDDPELWEYPRGFDHNNAVKRFKRFVVALNFATGKTYEFETESHIQDASFHSQINLGNGWLRFSNFGDMVAVTPDCEITPELRGIVQQLLLQHEYVFVETEFAEAPYTGQNPGVTGIEDWWIRYFDWV
jgi:hypothetical protein